MLREAIRKAAHYVRPSYQYWRLTDGWVAPGPGRIGAYPLDLQQRVAEGHYRLFDPGGVPYLPARSGREATYLVSRMCGYALAAWPHLPGTLPREAMRDRILRTAHRLLDQSAPLPAGGRMVYSRTADGRVVGSASALNQGHAISVWLRAHALDPTPVWLEAARAALVPFQVLVEVGGVRASHPHGGLVWYEEYTSRPLRHVLNGMIYALFALAELAAYAEDSLAESLFVAGCQSVEQTLPSYEVMGWSCYDILEGAARYPASMMYHNLHCCQLRVLHHLTGRRPFLEWARRWENQQRSIPRRLLAGSRLAFHKLRGGMADVSAF